MNINVEIVSGNNLGGVYPFVVACLDNDLANELHKTSAATAAPRCVWDADNAFCFDLDAATKAHVADGKPDPTYLTFFVFDTGAHGIPSLGSAGVLLATVRDKGIAKGDFPVVNGSGSLTLIVSEDRDSGPAAWFQSDRAKLAGAVGAVGLGALAAGLGARAVNKRRDKKKRDAAEADAEGDPDPHNAADAPAPAAAAAGDDRALGTGAGAGAQGGARPWWDPETSGEDDGDPARAHAGPSGAGYPAHNVYAQQAAPYQGGDAAAFIRGGPQAHDGYAEHGAYDPRTHA